MTDFHSLEELKAWLIKNGIDISQWGTGGTKSLANLWDELVNGDIAIQDNPPVRVVGVVKILIRKGDRVLTEVEQELGDGEVGRRRKRWCLPSEKMKPGEKPEDAALRCLKEELGLDEQDVISLKFTHEKVKESDSPSYPGLSTQYTFVTIEARVNGLPDTDFWRENTAYQHGDPVYRQHWGWYTFG